MSSPVIAARSSRADLTHDYSELVLDSTQSAIATKLLSTVAANGISESLEAMTASFGVALETNDSDNLISQQRIQRQIESQLIETLKEQTKSFELADVLPTITEGVGMIAQDDFSKCFTGTTGQPWNWNAYLYPLWLLGVILRYGILLPLRMIILVLGLIVLGICFSLTFLMSDGPLKAKHQRFWIRIIASLFVLSWTGVIQYHGVIPSRKTNQIYVANHTSMIDLIVLEQNNTFAAVGQQHKGMVAFVQNKILACLGCIWFDRASLNDKLMTAKRLREHITNPNSNRLILFPEGTCVNNEYCVQFKKGAFELGAEVCPIAIKYNKIFVDAFWNSKEMSFAMHLLTLMKSWAVVCDVYYLEPQVQLPGETSIEFAARVKAMIAERAGLKNVEFDGYLKHFKPSQRYVEEKQKLFAQNLIKKYPHLNLSVNMSEKKDSKKNM